MLHRRRFLEWKARWKALVWIYKMPWERLNAVLKNSDLEVVTCWGCPKLLSFVADEWISNHVYELPKRLSKMQTCVFHKRKLHGELLEYAPSAHQSPSEREKEAERQGLPRRRTSSPGSRSGTRTPRAAGTPGGRPGTSSPSLAKLARALTSKDTIE